MLPVTFLQVSNEKLMKRTNTTWIIKYKDNWSLKNTNTYQQGLGQRRKREMQMVRQVKRVAAWDWHSWWVKFLAVVRGCRRCSAAQVDVFLTLTLQSTEHSVGVQNYPSSMFPHQLRMYNNKFLKNWFVLKATLNLLHIKHQYITSNEFQKSYEYLWCKLQLYTLNSTGLAKPVSLSASKPGPCSGLICTG